MTDAFSDARKSLEILPGVGTLEFAVAKLARAGIELPRVRGWALDVSAEYGILAYVRPRLDRIIADAAAETAVHRYSKVSGS